MGKIRDFFHPREAAARERAELLLSWVADQERAAAELRADAADRAMAARLRDPDPYDPLNFPSYSYWPPAAEKGE
jgi:hypothetical protein